MDAARRFLSMAGDHVSALDMGKAEAYYRRALELTPSGHPARGRALAKVAESGWEAGRLDFDEVDALYAEAIEELKAAGDLRAAGETMVRRYLPTWARGDTVRATELIQDAIALLEPLGPSPELAMAYNSYTARMAIGGDEVAALEWAEKTLDLAREIGAEQVVARVLQYRGMARLAQGDPGGYDDLRDALRLALELGLARPAAVAYNNLADWINENEGPLRSYELYQEGIEFSVRRGMPGNARWSRMEATFRLYEMGRWDELLTEEDELIQADRGEGSGGQITVQALSFKALVLAMRGQVEEGAALMEDFLPRARAIGDVQPKWAAFQAAATIEHLRGEEAAAIELIDELLETFAEIPYSLVIGFAARALVATGQVERAASLLAGPETPMALWRLARATAEAVVLEAEGSFEDAMRGYLDVAERWAGFSSVVEQAHALLGAGRCLLALGRPTEATEQLTAAREIWAPLGAKPYVDEIDGYLAEATALTS
jgi:tetratricopeptide (TPR) repeat protein